MRVVSLLPGATEIVAALGVSPVAVSHECDYPPAVREAPAVTRSRIDPDAGSAEIDRQVLEAREDGGVYDVDLDVLAHADPDVILTQGMCEVCAVDPGLVFEAVERLGLDAEILTLDPHSLGDVFDDVRRVGAAIDRTDRADALVSGFRDRIETAGRIADEHEDRPRTVVLDWTDPVMVAGHWVPELVDLVSGVYGMADAGDPSTPHEWEEVCAYDPEVLVVAPCGFDLSQTRRNLADLTEREGWASIAAVESGRVYAMNGHDYVNRPGPRLVDTLEHLAGLLHPNRFDAPPRTVAEPIRTSVRPSERN